MRVPHLIVCLLLVVSGCAQTTIAEPIFHDDFQDGKADGWGAGGDGDVRLTTYQGNVSMRLSKRASSFAAITTEGYRNVRITASFAADDLEQSDACIAEASADDGQIWINILRVEDGRDDAVTMHHGALRDERLDNAARVIIRVRAAGNSSSDLCWFDDVRVDGDWIADMPVVGSGFSIDFLTGDMPMLGPVKTDAYAPSSSAQPAVNDFEGRLRFTVALADVNQRILLDSHDYNANKNPKLATLPAFDFDLVSRNGRLLPAKRGFIASSHPFWEYVLTPGRVWQEPGEKGWNRAALPFALVEKNANCTHNGLLTFLYKADGSVSRVAYQIGSETCAYFKFDAWGVADAEYVVAAMPSSRKLVAADARERSKRLPVRPIETLGLVYPDVDPEAFGSVTDINPDNMTAYGLVLDGTHYVGGCQTRYGPYPYCDELVLPSFSVAKSLFGGLALMRLEQLYPGAKDALIRDYVPECAASGSWRGVTFEHALDMATGYYHSSESDVDEGAALGAGFFNALGHDEKIRHACSYYSRKTAPGQRWVYHTSDTYLLGTAMQAFLRAHAGAQADIYRDLLVEPIFKPLGLSSTLDQTRRTYDAAVQPFTGWGLVMQRGDLARLMQFVGRPNEHLDPALHKAALQRIPTDTGLQAGAETLRYNNGFWAWNYQTYGNCNAPAWIPFMSGFGGISAVLIPNGVSYYYVSDGYEFTFARAVREAEKIRPVCESAR